MALTEAVHGCLVRRRTLLLVAAPVVGLALARPQPAEYAAGLALVVLGQALRLWSAGHITKGEALAVGGPYARVRNPLYLGSLVITLGWGAMSGRLAVAAGLLAVYLLTHWPTVLAEERDLGERFEAAFRDYCRGVPRLVPRWRALPGACGRFSWHRALGTNGEGVSAVGVALLATAYGTRL